MMVEPGSGEGPRTPNIYQNSARTGPLGRCGSTGFIEFTSLTSRRGRRLNVWRWRRQVRWSPRFVHLQFKIGRFFQQGGGNLGVFGYLGELKKNRCLTQEILSTDHPTFHCGIPAPTPVRGSRRVRSNRKYKSGLRDFAVTGLALEPL